MIGTCAGIVKAPRLRCGSSIVKCLRSIWARVFEYKQVLHSCCIGQSMNGCIRPIHGRLERVSMSNLSISHCPNSKQRFGSPSCGLTKTDGKAKTTTSSYTRAPLCRNRCRRQSIDEYSTRLIWYRSSLNERDFYNPHARSGRRTTCPQGNPCPAGVGARHQYYWRGD